jgi:hypothetical protein
VVAQRLAVIRREHDERAVGLPRLVEHREDAAELVVDLGHHPVVGRLELALLLRIVRRRHERVTDHQPEQRVLRAFLGARRRPHRVRHRRGVEHRVVRRGREERWVRTEIREVREPRCVRRGGAVVDEVEHPVGEEDRLRVLRVVLRAPARARGGFVDVRAPLAGQVDPLGAQPVEPTGGVALGQVAHRVEAGQHTFVRAEPRVVGGDRARVDAAVGVSEQGGLVAQIARDERDVRVACVERRAVEHRPVVHQVHARVERRPARPARRGLREMPPERDAARGEPVEVRGPDHRVAGAAETVAPPLVGGDEQDIQATRGTRHRRTLRHAPRRPVPDRSGRESALGPRCCCGVKRTRP